MIRHGIVEALLWYNVLSLGIWFGGTLYQMLVIVPLWSAAPPQSVRNFFTATGYTRTINHFFGRRTQALRAIPLFLLPIAGWAYPELQLWLAIPALAMAIALAMTLAYLYPINDVLIFKAGSDLDGETIQQLTRRWILADRIRFGIMTIGFVSLLYAFRLPYAA
jgi:Domain of unknown function (DUF1772)